MFRQPRQHAIAALAISCIGLGHLAIKAGPGNLVGGHLVDGCRMQVRCLFHHHQPVDDITARAHPANPQARRQGLGKRAAIDGAGRVDISAALKFQSQNRWNRLAVISQCLVGTVFNDGDIQFIRQIKHPVALRQRQRLAGRIDEIGRQVGELDFATGSFSGRRIVTGRLVGHQ